ncbi:MAG: IS66 family insertion sequence element accessory protein TnpB [Bacilli bacterium]
MININKVSVVFIASDYVDFRKSINGLVSIILNEFKLSHDDNSVFVFCSKGRDKIKIIHHDCNGYWLYYKVLDKDKFRWPKDDKLMEFKLKDLRKLLSGFDISQFNGFKQNTTEYLY